MNKKKKKKKARNYSHFYDHMPLRSNDLIVVLEANTFDKISAPESPILLSVANNEMKK